MPSVPGVSTSTIGDLIPEVVDALRGRSDVSTSAPLYIQRALQTLTSSGLAFEELRRTGPQVALTSGVSNYPVANFLNPADDYTSPEVFVVFIDYPTNTVTGNVDYKTPKAIEQMTSAVTIGVPSRFTRYGTEFFFGPTPNNPYTVFLRYQVRHPFPDNLAGLTNAPIFIPEDWEDIVIYMAAERIALIKGWNDQYATLHTVLYGTDKQPGLYIQKREQFERDNRFNSRQIGINIPRYNAR